MVGPKFMDELLKAGARENQCPPLCDGLDERVHDMPEGDVDALMDPLE